MNARLFPAALVAAAGTASAQPPATRAVLLDDFRVVVGTVQQIDGYVRVTPAAGPAVVVPAANVLHQADDAAAVYTFVAGKVDTASADGLTRLSAWCEKAGLADKAVTHARAAAALAPADAKLTARVKELEAKAEPPRRAVTRERPEPARPRDAHASPLDRGGNAVPADAAAVFASRVQPILMNRCAACHAQPAHPGAFKLDRATNGYANPDAAAANLSAAAAQLDKADPAASPLLTYSVTAHGGQPAAFPTRGHPGFASLEAWVYAAIGPPKPAAAVVAAAPPRPLPPLPKAEPVAAAPPKPAPTPAVVPAAAVVPADPFDPAAVNALPRPPGGR